MYFDVLFEFRITKYIYESYMNQNPSKNCTSSLGRKSLRTVLHRIEQQRVRPAILPRVHERFIISTTSCRMNSLQKKEKEKEGGRTRCALMFSGMGGRVNRGGRGERRLLFHGLIKYAR